LAASVVPAMAWADGGTPSFGKAGQLAISWDQALGTPFVAAGATPATSGIAPLVPGSWSLIDFQYVSLNNNGGSATQFGLAPAADYFVIDNLSVGGQVMFSIESNSPSQGQGNSYTSVGIAPQVGYNIGLTDRISVWPKLFFGFETTSVSNNGPSYNEGAIGVFVPFLYHPVQHFFLGLGPNFATQLISNVSPGNGAASQDGFKATTFGITATFGGYFLGD
jgi:hypothetical protein